MLSRRSACFRHSGRLSTSPLISTSSSWMRAFIHSICSRISTCMLLCAVPRRFCSAVRISTSCSRLVTSALRRISWASFGARASGWILKAYSAIKRASIPSVLSSLPVALDYALTRVGLTTATGRLFKSMVWTTNCSYPPVASTAISCRPSAATRAMISATPSSSFDTRQTALLPHKATSSQVLPTSIPTYASFGVVIGTIPPYNRDEPTLARIRPLSATQLFGLSWIKDTAVVLRVGLLDLMTSGQPCPLYYHTNDNDPLPQIQIIRGGGL